MGLPGAVIGSRTRQPFYPSRHLPERRGLPGALCREGLRGQVGTKWCGSLWVRVLALPGPLQR